LHSTRITLYCGSWLILCSSSGLAADPETRTFPEADCSYTLPGKDWEWLDPKQAQRPSGTTIIHLRSTKGLRLFVRFDPLKKDEPASLESSESYEAGMIAAGHTKLGSKRVMFKGVPSYQIEMELTFGRGASIRIMKVHGRVYELQLVNPAGPLDPEMDTEPIFQGFSFTKPPEPIPPAPKPAPSKSSDGDTEDVDVSRGRDAGLCCCCVGVLIVGGAVVGLIIYLVRRRMTNARRQRDDDDEGWQESGRSSF
jgi:hypothetical protein